MAKNNTTKSEITELAEKLIRMGGYHSFSYHDIASKLDIKNAAIHYHFPLKEDLAVGVIKKNIIEFSDLIENEKYKKLDEWKQLIKFMDDIFGKYVEESRICLVGALSAEFSTLPAAVQEEFKLMTEDIRRWLVLLLKNGKKKGYFNFNTTAEVKALMIITNMIAGLQIARVMNKNDFQLIKTGILKELKPE